MFPHSTKQGGGELSKGYDEAVLVITDKEVAESDSKIFLPSSYIDDSVQFGQQVLYLYLRIIIMYNNE